MKIFRICLALLCAGAPARAYNPFQDDLRRQQQQKQDPNSFTRPQTSGLKGVEIREFRDRMNAVKEQVFKDGSMPMGGKLQNTKDNTFQAEAKVSQFSESVKSRILAALPGARIGDARVAVEVTALNGKVDVSTVRMADGSTPAIRIPTLPAAANNPVVRSAAPGAPRTNAPSSSLNVPRAPAASAGNAPRNADPQRPAAGDTDRNDDPGTEVSQRETAGEIRRDPSAVGARAPAPTLPDAAFTIAGLNPQSGGQVRMEQRPAFAGPPRSIPVAVVSLASAGELVVSNVSNNQPGVTQFTVQGNLAAMPAALREQIQTDLPQAAQALKPDAEVKVTVNLKAGDALSVTSVQTVPSPARPPAVAAIRAMNFAPTRAANLPALNAPVNAPALAAESPADAARAAVDNRALAAATIAAPNLAAAAKTLAAWVGLPEGNIRTENRPSAENAGRLVPTAILTSPGGAEVSVQLVESRPGESPVYRVQGQLSDMSLETKGKVVMAMDTVGAADAVRDDSLVELDMRPSADGRFDLAAVSVERKSEAQTIRQTVLLWSEPPARSALAAPALNGSRPAAERNAERLRGRNDGSLRLSNPVFSQTRGLMPAAAAIARDVLNLKQGEFRTMLDPSDPSGPILIAPVAKAAKPVPMEWRFNVETNAHEFTVEGSPVEFSDEVQKEIMEQLKAAIEQGAVWAKEALDGKKTLVTEFAVVEDAVNQSRQTVVKAVYPPVQDAAIALGREMGLTEADYLVVTNGRQAVLALEKGVSAQTSLGLQKPLRLTSPDGSVKIYLKGDPSRRQGGLLMFLSKAALQANAAAIIQAGGPKAKAAVDKAFYEAGTADEFAVMLDPQKADPLAIVPVQGPTRGDPKKGKGAESVWKFMAP